MQSAEHFRYLHGLPSLPYKHVPCCLGARSSCLLVLLRDRLLISTSVSVSCACFCDTPKVVGEVGLLWGSPWRRPPTPHRGPRSPALSWLLLPRCFHLPLYGPHLKGPSVSCPGPAPLRLLLMVTQESGLLACLTLVCDWALPPCAMSPYGDGGFPVPAQPAWHSDWEEQGPTWKSGTKAFTAYSLWSVQEGRPTPRGEQSFRHAPSLYANNRASQEDGLPLVPPLQPVVSRTSSGGSAPPWWSAGSPAGQGHPKLVTSQTPGWPWGVRPASPSRCVAFMGIYIFCEGRETCSVSLSKNSITLAQKEVLNKNITVKQTQVIPVMYSECPRLACKSM